MNDNPVTLNNKYLQHGGRVFMNANQALVRLPLDQARRDRALGRKTAGFISGYRGSPLGVYDSALWGAQAILDEHDIRFRPGLNEELALSAIRGTQELHWFGQSDYDGVFGLWYGKGIGVDRACESMKLGNFEGAAADGGFLVVAGDDHGGKSSDSAHQSEHTLIAAMIPVLYPSTIDEIIEFGLAGWAMSRFSGCYVGLKTITDTLDLSACIELPDPLRDFQSPTDITLPAQGLNCRENLPPLVEEEWLVNYRLPAATAFARANGLDRVIIDGPRRELAIISAGKAYLDLRQALEDLGLDEAACQRLGIRVYKPGLIWPMDPQGLEAFARGSSAVLVVEEKRPVIEDQVARHLYALAGEERPALAGKRRRPPGLFLSGVSAQHQHKAARGFARDGRYRLPRPRRSRDGPRHHAVHAHGARGLAVDIGQPVRRHTAHVPEHGRRHLLPLRRARRARRGGVRRQHDVQDPVQRRRGDDRRPAGRTGDFTHRHGDAVARRGRSPGLPRVRRPG
jgi:indolepyruvate ferredoxin oxidoreductase